MTFIIQQHGRTVLHYAAIIGDERGVQELLSKGANANAVDTVSI